MSNKLQWLSDSGAIESKPWEFRTWKLQTVEGQVQTVSNRALNVNKFCFS